MKRSRGSPTRCSTCRTDGSIGALEVVSACRNDSPRGTNDKPSSRTRTYGAPAAGRKRASRSRFIYRYTGVRERSEPGHATRDSTIDRRRPRAACPGEVRECDCCEPRHVDLHPRDFGSYRSDGLTSAPLYRSTPWPGAWDGCRAEHSASICAARNKAAEKYGSRFAGERLWFLARIDAGASVSRDRATAEAAVSCDRATERHLALREWRRW